MRLRSLLAKKRLDVDLLIFDLQAEYLMRVVNVLVNEGIFKHFARAQLDKQVPRHIIGQVSHDHGSPSSLFDRATVDFQEVEVAVDVHLAVLVVKDACCRQNLTIVSGEVEQGLELVDVGALHEVGRVERHLEPARHCQLLEAVDTVVGLLVDGHVHGELLRIEVEHNSLLTEAESGERPSDHIVYVIV